MVSSLLERLLAAPDGDRSPVLMAGWNSVRDFIDVQDVTAAYLAILDLDAPTHRTFNVCTGMATSIQEVVQTVLDLLGQEREISFQSKPNSNDDIPYLVGDPSLLSHAAGWTARHSLTDSLCSMIQAISRERPL